MDYLPALLVLGVALGSSAAIEFTPCSSTPTGTLLPSPTSPHHFELCKDGHPFTLECPPSLIFNTALSMCDRPSNMINSGPQTPSAGSDCPLSGNETLSYPRNCSVYKVCVEGIHYFRYCPTGQAFHPTKLQCVPASEMPLDAPCSKASTVPEDISCEGKPTGDYITDKKDCAKYYICVGEVPVPEDCPGKLLFHPTEKFCVNPEDMPELNQCEFRVPTNPCKDAENYDEVGDRFNCSLHYTCFEGKVVNNASCPLDWVFVNPTEGCRKFEGSMAEPECMQKNPVEKCRYMKDSDGAIIDNVADPDCTGYYQCLNKEAMLIPCLPGLVYDNIKEKCENKNKLDPTSRCYVAPEVPEA